jgi:hypothetical protein
VAWRATVGFVEPSKQGERVMINLEKSIVINRPMADVFNYIATPANETAWQADLVESKFTSPEPVDVGSEGRDLRKFMGRQIETIWQVTAFQPNHKMAFKVIKGPMLFEASYSFVPVKNGTELTFQAWAQTKGISRLFDPLVNWMGNKQYERDLGNLKSVLEGQA